MLEVGFTYAGAEMLVDAVEVHAYDVSDIICSGSIGCMFPFLWDVDLSWHILISSRMCSLQIEQTS